MKLKNATIGICVICDKPIENNGMYMCKNCLGFCNVNVTNILSPSDKTVKGYFLLDIKSVCCNSDVQLTNKITCSEACHEVLVQDLTKEFGEFRKVVTADGKKSYKVPVRYIIENGLNVDDLGQFPEWTDEK